MRKFLIVQSCKLIEVFLILDLIAKPMSEFVAPKRKIHFKVLNRKTRCKLWKEIFVLTA